MKKISEPIVFFGSGPVAAKSLELLINDFELEAVITKKPKHSTDQAPVIDIANANQIPLFLPNNKTELSEIIRTSGLKSRIAILIDYGVIVSLDVINYFKLGIINSHFSLLPDWRGADPITFAILSGKNETGVSLMLLTEGIDEGQLLSQKTVDINNRDSLELTDELIKVSHELLVSDLPKYITGDIKPFNQPDRTPTYSRKLTKEDGKINWDKEALQIEREIRAYIVWPKSYTNLAGIDLIITKAHRTNLQVNSGKAILHNGELVVGCGKGSLIIEELKPSGKKNMTAKEFLAGYKHLLS